MTLESEFRAYILSLSPIAYWPFEGNAPGAILDVTGNGHDLTGHGTYTLNNAVDGFDGFTCAVLDGSSGYFSAGNASTLRPSKFAVMALMFPQACDSIIYSTESGVTLTAGSGLIIQNTTNSCKISERTGTGSGNVIAADIGSFGARGAGFSIVGGSHDGVNTVFYYNGSPVGAALNTTYSVGSETPAIGRYAGDTRGYFKGSIAQVAVWDRPLTLNEWNLLVLSADIPVQPNASQLNDKLDLIYNAVHHVFPAT